MAALLPVLALTAHQVLADAVALRHGETVLVHGAGGITGGMLVATAADMGASVIATTGPDSAERVRGYRASIVLDYHHDDWPGEVNQLTGGGVPVAVNAVPGAAGRLMPLVMDGGQVATITSDPPPEERRIRISSVYVRSNGIALERLAARFSQRGLSLPIARVYGLSEAGTALSARAAAGVVIDPRN